jgi:phosphate transport system substrate-binding protein
VGRGTHLAGWLVRNHRNGVDDFVTKTAKTEGRSQGRRLPIRIAGWAAAVVVLGADVACGGRAAARAITLAGSTSVQPCAERWADAYRARQPDVRIHVQGGGSTAGVQAALSGAAEIGMSSRPLTPDESRLVTGIPVARDGIAMVVHPTAAARDLTLADVRAVYAGDIRNWRHFGGRDLPITVITREEGSGTRAAFEALVMDGRRIAAFALVQDSTGGVRQMVASDPAAIGYVSIGLVDASIRALKLQSIEPTEANIDAGRYPLVRSFLFVVPPGPAGTVKDFIDWITGPEGRSLARREGLLPPET